MIEQVNIIDTGNEVDNIFQSIRKLINRELTEKKPLKNKKRILFDIIKLDPNFHHKNDDLSD